MKTSLRGPLILFMAGVAVSAMLACRHFQIRAREEIVSQTREVNRRLAGERDAAVAAANRPLVDVSPTDDFSLVRLRSEIAELKKRADDRNRRPAIVDPTRSRTIASIHDEMVPPEAWRRSGDATPPATLETALWAVAGGNVDVLSDLLSMDASVRTEVNRLLLTLPAAIRGEYHTPERLIALLAAADVPLVPARIYQPKLSEPTGTPVLVVMDDGAGISRRAALTLRQDNDAWKIVVPVTAVQRYAVMLKGDEASPASSKQ